jgi:hypothetical protein
MAFNFLSASERAMAPAPAVTGTRCVRFAVAWRSRWLRAAVDATIFHREMQHGARSVVSVAVRGLETPKDVIPAKAEIQVAVAQGKMDDQPFGC